MQRRRPLRGTSLGLVATFLAGAMATGGCEWDPGAPDAEYGFPPIPLTAVPYHSGDHLIAPGGVEVVDEMLLIFDSEGGQNIHVVDRETGNLVESIGNVGRGPGEFLTAHVIARDAERRPWVFDVGGQRLTRLDLSRLGDGVAWAPETVAFDSMGQMISFAWLNATTGLGAGVFDGGRFAILSRGGEYIRFEGGADIKSRVSQAAPRDLYLSRVSAHPALGRVAAASVWFDEVAILDENGRVVAMADTPFDRKPHLVIEDGSTRVSEDSRNAYAAVATTRDHIYALFADRSAAEHGITAGLGRDIHVFDWNGALVTVLRVDRDAFALDVDEARNGIYIIELHPTPAISWYALPPCLWLDHSDGGCG